MLAGEMSPRTMPRDTCAPVGCQDWLSLGCPQVLTVCGVLPGDTASAHTPEAWGDEASAPQEDSHPSLLLLSGLWCHCPGRHARECWPLRLRQPRLQFLLVGHRPRPAHVSLRGSALEAGWCGEGVSLPGRFGGDTNLLVSQYAKIKGMFHASGTSAGILV